VFQSIAITGRGMVSALGLDVETCCAAARAGILRSRELAYFSVHNPEDGSVENAIGHAADFLTQGFEGDARLLRLLQAGLADLMRQTPTKPWVHKKTGFYLSMPDPRRCYTGIDLIPDETEREALKQVAAQVFESPLDTGNYQGMLNQAAALCGWEGETTVKGVYLSDHTAVAEALMQAINAITRKEIDIAIVGGAESLLEENVLAWLENTGRLKSPAIGAGLQPGEASAFIVLQPLRDAAKLQDGVYGFINHISFAEEDNTLLSGKTALGKALTRVISESTTQETEDNLTPVWLFSDINGEVYRAMEWGYATMRLTQQSERYADPVLWFSAGAFGDTGAVNGAISICMATEAFRHNYAPASTSVLLSSSDARTRSAVVLTKSA